MCKLFRDIFGLHRHVYIQTGSAQVRLLIDAAQKSLPTGMYPIKLEHVLLLTSFLIAQVSLTVIPVPAGGNKRGCRRRKLTISFKS